MLKLGVISTEAEQDNSSGQNPQFDLPPLRLMADSLDAILRSQTLLPKHFSTTRLHLMISISSGRNSATATTIG